MIARLILWVNTRNGIYICGRTTDPKIAINEGPSVVIHLAYIATRIPPAYLSTVTANHFFILKQNGRLPVSNPHTQLHAGLKSFEIWPMYLVGGERKSGGYRE